MTKTRVLALLSVIALLAVMPLSVALAQRLPPDLVKGMVMLDGEAPPEGTMINLMVETTGEDDSMMMDTIGMVDVMADGSFLFIVEDNKGKTATFSLTMGEGDDMMEYKAESMQEVMIGEDSEGVMLEAMTGAVPPTRTPVQVTDSMRGPRGPQGLPGEAGAAGEAGPAGAAGARGPVGPVGPAGADGNDGSAGPVGPAGSAGSDGSDGSDGSGGSAGARGPAGSAGPAGADGATGPAGPGGSAGADGGGGVLAIVALIIAIVGVVAAGGVFIAGRQSG